MSLSKFRNIQQVNTQSANKQKGFTLIELVVVIVILGILAVTAAPKFIDVSADARKSVMKAVKGSIESAVSMAQSKALINNQTGATGVILIGGKYYALVNSYPAAVAVGDGSADDKGLGIASLIEIDSEITVTATAPITFTHSGAAVAATCQLTYTDAANSETRPVIAEALTAC